MTARKSAGRKRRRYDDRPKFPPIVNHRITLDKAIDLTQRYRKAAPASEHGGLFDARQVRDLLSQEDCVGFRYYHGIEKDGSYHLVLVGVNSRGEDILPQNRPKREQKRERGARASVQQQARPTAMLAMATTSGGGAVILENHLICPPVCSSGSPLN